MYNSDLYDFAEKRDITIDILPIPKNKSMSIQYGNTCHIALNTHFDTSSDERVHLGHELGHCETGSFYTEGENKFNRIKSEATATRWAVKNLIQKEKLIALLKKDYQNWELAEYFNVTEDFIKTSIYLYFEVGMAG